ncbi:MAG: hypothetical protein P8Z50_05085 [candidate division WOR-3 bacterium]
MILEVFPIPIDIVDMDLNILYMNNALKEKVGRDAVGEKCFEVYKDSTKLSNLEEKSIYLKFLKILQNPSPMNLQGVLTAEN